MDIVRSFGLRIEETQEENYTLLEMSSYIDGEYGSIQLLTTCALDARLPSIHSVFLQTSAEAYEHLHPFMEHEIFHFMKILPLFHTFNKPQNEVPLPASKE